MPGALTLTDVAEELYALAPEEFTRTRDAAARRARDDGDRDLAAALKALRRPSLGAWLVNQLVRNRPDEIGELLDLGTELRAAQEALDGAELRTMTRQRQQAISRLFTSARELASESGHQIAEAAQREFESTLDAALADEDAAHAVRSARLMRALTSTGLAAVDLTAAVAAPGPAAPKSAKASSHTAAKKVAAKKPAKKPAAKVSPRTTAADRAKAERARAERARAERARADRARQQAVADARVRVERSERDLADRQGELDTARAAVSAARDKVAELDAALTAAGKEQAAAERDRRRADQAAKAAARERAAAQRTLDAADKKHR